MTPDNSYAPNLKTNHYFSIATGASELALVSSIHAIAPFNQVFGHSLALISFFIYVIFAIAHLHHSAVAIKEIKYKETK